MLVIAHHAFSARKPLKKVWISVRDDYDRHLAALMQVFGQAEHGAYGVTIRIAVATQNNLIRRAY